MSWKRFVVTDDSGFVLEDDKEQDTTQEKTLSSVQLSNQGDK